MGDHGTKTTPYFYLLMKKALVHYFQVRSLYYQAAECNQKTPIPSMNTSVHDGGQWYVDGN